MAINLTNLLIETIFKEESNDDAILDTLIPNPATGKNIKVRSALSRTDHPAYNAAKEYIAGKMSDGETAQQPAEQQPEEQPAEEQPDAHSDEEAMLMSQGFDEEQTSTMLDIKNSGAEIDTAIEKISNVEPNTWKQLSPQRQKEMNDDYTTKIGEKRDNLRSQIDAYTENGIEAPVELTDEYNAYNDAANERELAGMTDEEKASHYEEEGETLAAKKYGDLLNKINIDQELANTGDQFENPETATGLN